MTSENQELIKEFNIGAINAIINNRCDRTYCRCGAIIEDGKCSCTYEEGLEIVRLSMGEGQNIIYRDKDNLYARNEPGNPTEVYYKQLVAYIDMKTGIITFSIQDVVVAKVDNTQFELIMPTYYGNGNISVKNLFDVLEKEGIRNEELNNYLKIANGIGFYTFSQLAKYIEFVKRRGFTIFGDEEFAKSHHSLIKQVLERCSSTLIITNESTMCEYFEIPYCLREFMKDPYFSKMTGYSDIRAFEEHPTKIKGVFAYYISVGKFNRKTVKSYLEVFRKDFWQDSNSIDCFLNFLRKNLWMGDGVFQKAYAAFQYAINNKHPINESTINSKFLNGMRNVELLTSSFDKAIADEFHMIRDMQGIVPALKYLTEWVEQQKAESE